MKLHATVRPYLMDTLDIDPKLLQSRRRVKFSIPEDYIKFDLGVETTGELTKTNCDRIITELKTRGVMPISAKPVGFWIDCSTGNLNCVVYDFSFKPVEADTVPPPTIIVGNS